MYLLYLVSLMALATGVGVMVTGNVYEEREQVSLENEYHMAREHQLRILRALRREHERDPSLFPPTDPDGFVELDATFVENTVASYMVSGYNGLANSTYFLADTGEVFAVMTEGPLSVTDSAESSVIGGSVRATPTKQRLLEVRFDIDIGIGTNANEDRPVPSTGYFGTSWDFPTIDIPPAPVTSGPGGGGTGGPGGGGTGGPGGGTGGPGGGGTGGPGGGGTGGPGGGGTGGPGGGTGGPGGGTGDPGSGTGDPGGGTGGPSDPGGGGGGSGGGGGISGDLSPDLSQILGTPQAAPAGFEFISNGITYGPNGSTGLWKDGLFYSFPDTATFTVATDSTGDRVLRIDDGSGPVDMISFDSYLRPDGDAGDFSMPGLTFDNADNLGFFRNGVWTPLDGNDQLTLNGSGLFWSESAGSTPQRILNSTGTLAYDSNRSELPISGIMPDADGMPGLVVEGRWVALTPEVSIEATLTRIDLVVNETGERAQVLPTYYSMRSEREDALAAGSVLRQDGLMLDAQGRPGYWSGGTWQYVITGDLSISGNRITYNSETVGGGTPGIGLMRASDNNLGVNYNGTFLRATPGRTNVSMSGSTLRVSISGYGSRFVDLLSLPDIVRVGGDIGIYDRGTFVPFDDTNTAFEISPGPPSLFVTPDTTADPSPPPDPTAPPGAPAPPPEPGSLPIRIPI